MPENKSPETNPTPAPPLPNQAPGGAANTPEPPLNLPPEAMVQEAVPVESPIPQTKTEGTRPLPAAKPALPKNLWWLAAAVLTLLVVLVIAAIGNRGKTESETPAVQSTEKTEDLSNYTAFIAENKELIEKKPSEQVLTAEPFAGEAPLAVREGGPLSSRAGDPQLAALAEALMKRVRIMHGYRDTEAKGQVVRSTKGEYRGFRVNAQEKRMNGAAVHSEIIVSTPGKGVVRTVNRILQQLDRTDLNGMLSEVHAAGLETIPLAAGGDVFRVQLRPVRPWGKPVAAEWLIAAKTVGAISLGLPVDRIKGNLAPATQVLKRKILVNDAYYDVYKATDASGEPLFYAYEKAGRVWGISVVSPAFRTVNGIGIGSSLDQMRISYPEVRLAHSERKTPFARVQGVDGIFIFHSDTRQEVVAILIGESPEFE